MGAAAMRAPSGRTGSMLRVGAFSATYFLANMVALLFPDTNKVLASVWPAAGIGLAALLLSERRLWPALAAGIFAAGIAADLLGGRPLANSLGFMAANLAESFSCALLVQLLCGRAVRFRRIPEMAALVLAAVVCNGATAVLGAGTAALAWGASFGDFWFTWWVADGLGLLLVAPLVVSWGAEFGRIRALGWRRAAEALAFGLLWCAAAWLAFQDSRHPILIVPQPYMLFALLVYAAGRLGLRGTSAMVLLLAAILLGSDSVQEGGLIWGGATVTARVIQAQIFLASVIVTGYFLSAAFAERRAAGRELAESKAKLETAFNVAPLALILLDGANTVRYWNAAAERTFGWTAAEAVGKPLAIVPPAMQADFDAFSARLMKEGAVSGYETRRARKDGTLLEVSVSAAGVRAAGGALLGRVAIIEDISGRKAVEARLKGSLAEKEVLLKELYHRTKNNMNVIISLLSLQARQSGDPALVRAFDEAENRIYAMALVHQKLYESGDLSRLELGGYLGELCAHLVANYAVREGAVALLRDTDEVTAPIDAAIPCGLVANELVSNALKYAFPGDRRGTIALRLRRGADGVVTLRIEDDGVGVAGGIGGRMGFGLKTVEGLCRSQLEGEVSFETAGGFACELRFRLPAAREGA